MSTSHKYQVHINGPLTTEAKEYLMSVKEKNKWSYKKIGERTGISEAFAYHLIHKNGNVTTNTYYKSIEEGIDRLKSGDISIPEVEKDDTFSPLLEHSYHLREGLQIALRLPADLTEREAERLSMFIRSLTH